MTKKRDIIVINSNISYEIKAETLMMGTQTITSTIKQVFVLDDEIFVRDLISKTEANLPVKEETFDDIFNETHTIVVPESMFVKESRVFKTENFSTYGLQPLKRFYEKGGTVFVLCIEGNFSAAQTINELFGTSWKIEIMDDTPISPTEKGKELFGPFCPQKVILQENPYFVACDPSEGYYEALLSTREEFEKDFHAQDEIFERLGVEKDESMTCFNVDKSWEIYKEKYTNKYAVAIRRNKNNGHVVWFGDRSQKDHSLAFCFCKLMNLSVLDPLKPRITDDDDKNLKAITQQPINWTFVLSFILMIVAILVKAMGLV